MFNFIKKFVAVLSLFALSTGLVSAQTLRTFPDVQQGTAFSNSIYWMLDNGIVNGNQDGSFKPDSCVNRAEFVKMLYNTMGISTEGYADVPLFKDTPAGQWYAPYVQAGRGRGSLIGYADGTFKPGECVNRAEAIKVVGAEFNLLDNGLIYYKAGDQYEDVLPNEWYTNYVDYALGHYLVSEDHVSGNKFDLAGGMTRKEVAEYLYRIKAVEDNNKVTYNYEKPFYNDEINFAKDCVASGSGYKFGTVNIENAIPKNADMLVGFDYTDTKQIAGLQSFLNKTGLKDLAKKDFGASQDFSFLLSPWEMLFAVTFDDSANESVVLAAVFKDAKDFRLFASKYIQKEYGRGINCDVDGKFVYWTDAEEDFYLASSGDLFLLAENKADLDAAIARVASGKKSFDLVESIGSNKVNEHGLFYVYVGARMLEEFLDANLDANADVLSGLNSSFVNVSFAGENMIFDFLGNYEKGSLILQNNSNYKVGLAAKIPSFNDNLLFYGEWPGWGGLSADFLKDISSKFGISAVDFASLTNVPVAAVFDVPPSADALPVYSFYFDMSNLDDAVFDKVLVYLDKMVAEIGNVKILPNGLHSVRDESDSSELFFGKLSEKNLFVISNAIEFGGFFTSSKLLKDKADYKAQVQTQPDDTSSIFYFNFDKLNTWLHEVYRLDGALKDEFVVALFDVLDLLDFASGYGKVDGSVFEGSVTVKLH